VNDKFALRMIPRGSKEPIHSFLHCVGGSPAGDSARIGPLEVPPPSDDQSALALKLVYPFNSFALGARKVCGL